MLWLLSLALAGIALVVAAGALPEAFALGAPGTLPETEVFAGFAGRIAAVEREGVSLLWPLLDYRREFEAELARRCPLSGGFERNEALQMAQRKGLTASE